MRIPLLEIRDVSYAMNGRQILDAVSWSVNEGENWAILGPNGAGKTTLLKLVCGYLWPNRGGKIYWNGETLIDLGTLRRSIGWVTSTLVADIPSSERAIDTVLSGKYAQLGLWPFPWEQPASIDSEAAVKCLAELECEDLAPRRFSTLSQGEQQKVLICRALMAKPYLIILDEPCAGMDPGARETFLSALSNLSRKGALPAFVYVTHHVEEILPAFTRTLIVRDGKVMMKGATEQIITGQTMRELYGIAVQLLKKNGRFWPIIGASVAPSTSKAGEATPS